MSEPKYREWILDTIDSLRSRKARPDLERICRMVRRRHGSEPERTCAELDKLIQEQTVLKVNYKGSISYRNAAKVQRRSRKKDDATTATATTLTPAAAAAAAAARRSAVEEEASHSDLSNGDSAVFCPADQDDDDDLEADTSLAMDTDSNADEEGPDESRDGQDAGPSPGPHADQDAPVNGASVKARSAPSSPSGGTARPGSGPGPGVDPGERPGSLPPPCSPSRALLPGHNDWAYHSAACTPAERQHPGMHKDKAVVKPAVHSACSSPGPALKTNMKREDGGKAEDSGPSPDQLVPDYAAGQDETKNVSDGKPQTLSLPLENCTFKNKIDISSFTGADDNPMNGNGDDISVKKENGSQNLLLWSVADVATYFSAAGFPEQAMAFRSQEIDGKSLLLMQRSDVLTGLSIRLGPALKIYERHVKVLQRTHFLEYEDL